MENVSRREINALSEPLSVRGRKNCCSDMDGESGYHHFVEHVFSIAKHFPHFFYFAFVVFALAKYFCTTFKEKRTGEAEA